MEVTYELSREEEISLRLSDLKELPFIGFINRRGVLLFTIIYFILLPQTYYLNYEVITGITNQTTLYFLDKGLLLLVSIVLGKATYHYLKRIYIFYHRNPFEEAPAYIYGTRSILTDKKGISLHYPKVSHFYSWDLIEMIETRSNYIRISIAADRKINIPRLAFKNEEKLSEFLKICEENRSDLIENWLKEKEEKKKLNKIKWGASKILRISILGVFFGPLSIVFLPFVLSMANDSKLALEKHHLLDEQHLEKLRTARIIAVASVIFWTAICLLLLVIAVS